MRSHKSEGGTSTTVVLTTVAGASVAVRGLLVAGATIEVVGAAASLPDAEAGFGALAAFGDAMVSDVVVGAATGAPIGETAVAGTAAVAATGGAADCTIAGIVAGGATIAFDSVGAFDTAGNALVTLGADGGETVGVTTIGAATVGVATVGAAGVADIAGTTWFVVTVAAAVLFASFVVGTAGTGSAAVCAKTAPPNAAHTATLKARSAKVLRKKRRGDVMKAEVALGFARGCVRDFLG
jgi:hypothetical protein